jgi:hypothetical protein
MAKALYAYIGLPISRGVSAFLMYVSLKQIYLTW